MVNPLKVAHELMGTYAAASVDHVPPQAPSHRVGPITRHAGSGKISRPAGAAGLVPVHCTDCQYTVWRDLRNSAMQMKHIELQTPGERKQGLRVGNEFERTFG